MNINTYTNIAIISKILVVIFIIISIGLIYLYNMPLWSGVAFLIGVGMGLFAFWFDKKADVKSGMALID